MPSIRRPFQWRPPVAERVDVVVLGMGVGGEELANTLADNGLNVVGIESHLVGGECPYYGCIPTKMMIRADDMVAEGRRIPGFAGESTVKADWTPVARRIRDVATDNWNDRVAVERFERKGGHFVRGAGKLAGPGKVSVKGTTYEASQGIVIATGTSPVVPPIPGLDRVKYWTNRDAVKVEELPESLVILGGGAIGVELAQVFARFGVKVSIIEGMDRVLAMEEPEASAVLGEVLQREGIELWLKRRAQSVEPRGDAIAVNLDGGRQVTGQALLVETEQRANLQDIGLETVGLGTPARAGRSSARGGAAVGHRRRDHERRLYSHGDLPRRHRGPGHPRGAGAGSRLPGQASRHVHRSRGGRGRLYWGAGEKERHQRAYRDPEGIGHVPRLDSRTRQRWADQGGRGRRPPGAGRRHHHGSAGWRSPRHLRTRHQAADPQ